MTMAEVFTSLKIIGSTISSLAGIYSVTRNAVPVPKNNLKSRQFHDMVRTDLYKLTKQITTEDATTFEVAKSKLESIVIEIRSITPDEDIQKMLEAKTCSEDWREIKDSFCRIRNSRTWHDVFLPVLSLKLSVFVQYIEAQLEKRQAQKALNLFLSQCRLYFCEVFNLPNKFDFANVLFDKPSLESADWQKLAAATREAFRAFIFFLSMLFRDYGKELTFEDVEDNIKRLFPPAFKLKSVSNFLTWIYDWQDEKELNQYYGSQGTEHEYPNRLSHSIGSKSGMPGEQKKPRELIEDIIAIPNSASGRLVLTEEMQQVVLVGKVTLDLVTGTHFIFASTIEWVPNFPAVVGMKNVQFYGSTSNKMKESTDKHEANFQKAISHDDIEITTSRVTAEIEPSADKCSMMESFRKLFPQPKFCSSIETTKSIKDVVRMWFRCCARNENCIAALDFDYSEGVIVPVLTEAVFSQHRLTNVFQLDERLFGVDTIRDEIPGKGRKPKVNRCLRFLEWCEKEEGGMWSEVGTINSASSSKCAGCRAIAKDGSDVNVFVALSSEKDEKFTTENQRIVVKLMMLDKDEEIQKVSIPNTSECRVLCGSNGKLVFVNAEGTVYVVEVILETQDPVSLSAKVVAKADLIVPAEGVKSVSVALIGLNEAFVVINGEHMNLVQLQGIP